MPTNLSVRMISDGSCWLWPGGQRTPKGGGLGGLTLEPDLGHWWRGFGSFLDGLSAPEGQPVHKEVRIPYGMCSQVPHWGRSTV